MSTELSPREFVIQPNAISQSIYSAGVYARRMMAMAMSLLPLEPDEKGEYTVSFSVDNFIKSLGLERGTNQRKFLMAAIEECTGNIIKIHDEKSGAYILHTWFETTMLHSAEGVPKWNSGMWTWDTITMTFNRKLAEALGDFRRQYAKIDLLDFGKLQSRYAIRIYELALSFHGYAGKEGNRGGEWFFEKSVEDIRLLFDIDPKKYKDIKNFRVRIIDQPIEEINAAGIGIRIEPVYIRRGKRLLGIHFNCRWIKKGEPLPVTPTTDTGQEDDRLKDTYPEEFEALKAEGRKQQKFELFKYTPHLEERAAEAYALTELRELHPEAPKKATKKRSSAKKNSG